MFNNKEFKIVKELVDWAAAAVGEDIMGVMLRKTSANDILTQQEIVALADKLKNT